MRPSKLRHLAAASGSAPGPRFRCDVTGAECALSAVPASMCCPFCGLRLNARTMCGTRHQRRARKVEMRRDKRRSAGAAADVVKLWEQVRGEQ